MSGIARRADLPPSEAYDILRFDVNGLAVFMTSLMIRLMEERRKEFGD